MGGEPDFWLLLLVVAGAARAKMIAPNGREETVSTAGMSLRRYRTTRALPPCISFSTSFCVAIEVSPGVVEAKAPCAAP